MPTSHLLTGDLSDLVGTDFPRNSVWVTIKTNLGDADVRDSTGKKIRLPRHRFALAADGTFSKSLWSTAALTNPTGYQYQVEVEWPDGPGGTAKKKWVSGWFSHTADQDLSELAYDPYIPPTYYPELLAARDEAVTAAADAETAQAAAEAAQTAAEAVGDTNDSIMAAVAADPESEFYAVQSASTGSTIAARGLDAAPAGRSSLLAPNPAPTQTDPAVVIDIVETGLENGGYLDVTDFEGFTFTTGGTPSAAPGRILWTLSTDHAAESFGLAYAWTDSLDDTPTAPDWSDLTISGLPGTLTQVEIAAVNLLRFDGVDTIVLTFSAQDTSAGNLQGNYQARSTDGSTFTYYGECTPLNILLPGDGHPAYWGKHIRLANGVWIVRGLAGGTRQGHEMWRGTTDFDTWFTWGPQEPRVYEWGATEYGCVRRVFSWRGETWATLSVRIAEITTYRPRVLNYVAKLAEDMTTTIGEWVPVTMPHADDGWIDAVVPIGNELRFYYRHGGATGDFRYLTAQG